MPCCRPNKTPNPGMCIFKHKNSKFNYRREYMQSWPMLQKAPPVDQRLSTSSSPLPPTLAFALSDEYLATYFNSPVQFAPGKFKMVFGSHSQLPSEGCPVFIVCYYEESRCAERSLAPAAEYVVWPSVCAQAAGRFTQQCCSQ